MGCEGVEFNYVCEAVCEALDARTQRTPPKGRDHLLCTVRSAPAGSFVHVLSLVLSFKFKFKFPVACLLLVSFSLVLLPDHPPAKLSVHTDKACAILPF
jgi:hypothetical protein